MATLSFPLFPKFPKEIRLNIWEAFSMLEPRIVEVCLIPHRPRLFASDFNENPFYTPTALPKSLFGIDRESRAVALKEYPLGFSSGDHPTQIRWNPFIDTIFLPGWSLHNRSAQFMSAISDVEKGKIQKLAFELLFWTGCDANGRIGDDVQINEFPNLKEVLLVRRLPLYASCGCCFEFDGPEKGVVGFKELDEEDEDEDERLNEREIDFHSREDTVEHSGPLRTDNGGQILGTMPEGRTLTPSEECRAMFIALHESRPDWKAPNVREVSLTRDDILV